MRLKPFLLSLCTIIILAIGGGIFIITALPKTADKALRTQLSSIGLTQVTLPAPEIRFGALRYADIPLDKDEKSFIDTLTITYNPLHLITSKHFKQVDIYGLALSGEMNRTGQLTFSGLENLKHLSGTDAIGTLTLKNATFSILSAHLGGIRLTTDLQTQNKPDGTSSWTGHIQSKQDQLTLIAKLNGKKAAQGKWDSTLEIENGKIERSIGKATRIHGLITMRSDDHAPFYIQGDLRAGGINLHNTPWHNAAITLNGTPNHFKTFTEAKSIGHSGLELSITTLHKDSKSGWNARIHAETLKTLFDYLQAKKRIPAPFSRQDLAPLNTQKHVDITIAKANHGFNLNVQNINENIDIKGTIKPQSRDAFSVQLAPPHPLLTALKNINCTETHCAIDVKF